MKSRLEVIKGVRVLTLRGSSYFIIGKDYGYLMRDHLRNVLDILLSFYQQDSGISYKRIVNRAELFYNRYSSQYKPFLAGMAEGAGLTLDECKILNGMETLNSLLTEKEPEVAQCTFWSLPPSRTSTGKTIIGRNYDFPYPFDKCAAFLTVTVIHKIDAIPTAILGCRDKFIAPVVLMLKEYLWN